jgi:hypothetical protein
MYLSSLYAKQKHVALLIAVLFLSLCSGAHVVHAASFSLSPANGTYGVGDSFTVGVYAASGGVSLNALSGTLSFPEDVLQVTNISKNQSIVSLWVQEPAFSNTSGTVSFEGIVLNPGYSGSNGKVLSVTFRVKAAGTASVLFSSGSILANDGSGSEILQSKGSARFVLAQQTQQQDTPSDNQADDVLSPESSGAVVTVSREGDPAHLWQANSRGVFTFTYPPTVTAIRLLLDRKPDSEPVVSYAPPISLKEILDLPEGKSFLHVQVRDQGGWGEVVHHTVAVDVTPPALSDVTIVESTVPEVAVFGVSATDTLSGVERFEVSIDGEAPSVYTGTSALVFMTQPLPAGTHTLAVSVYDLAGNSSKKQIEFTTAIRSPQSPASTQSTLLISTTALITVLSVVIPVLALLLLLLFIIILGYRQYRKYKAHIADEVREAQDVLKEAFTLIDAELTADIATLEKAGKKRPLTREEKKILKNLQQNLAGAQRVIADEIGDIT